MTKFAKEQLHKIDTLLRLFRKDEVGIPEHEIKGMLKHQKVEASDSEIKRFLYQLQEDGYIFFEEKLNLYIVTVKGVKFDGYWSEFKASRTRHCREVVQSYLLSVGTALAGLYALYDLLKWMEHRFFCSHFFS
ncbi:hypothetical protein [Mucilaginibacter ginsenosidivorans]|uniref:Uncharacterized protein n=1 Tax=Mucilaginibacter ginsenosidivorans TaxID=398053 RepID=A0A5B8UZG7_9SPHI|nr:hypothetical protein [Mucilaginibacter ginsenosidivorans]QEC63706.1 hypothetical protein FRZ54_14355 [Mucilaginibacter ginsenosidivorans]